MGGSVKVGTEERMKVRVRLPCCQLLQNSKGRSQGLSYMMIRQMHAAER